MDCKKPIACTVEQERSRLRQLIMRERDSLSPEEREQRSKQIAERLLTDPLVKRHQTFFIYCSYRSEVATNDLIKGFLQAEKIVAVPLCLPEQAGMQAVTITDATRDLCCGYRSIPEPIPSIARKQTLTPSQIDVAIIPGVVFDRSGHRLGYGGGYYDRFLGGLAPQAVRIGLAFSCQLVHLLPALPHDIPMDVVITEEELLRWPRLEKVLNSSVQ
ncbi:5-formyltetrahydrofolate cyclo-ligase [Desulfobulbus oligotrophicus]|nr:5-formyltetrahydrofolate cyclo-ligase [Desulfobulbus oligotrophicus]